MENRKPKKDENLFTVSLDGIALKEEQKEQIDKAIKSAVLVELAKIDYQKDIIINENLARNPKLIEFGKYFPYGIWIESFEKYRERMVIDMERINKIN